MRTAAHRSSGALFPRPPPSVLGLAGLTAALLATVGCAGCAEPVLVADEAGPLGSAPRHYAVGSVLELRVLAPSGAVRLVADDPSVMSTATERDGRYRLDARAEGATVLRVVDAADPTRVLGEHRIEVEAPSRARILAAAEHALGESDGNGDIRALAGSPLGVRLELVSIAGALLVGRGDVELAATSAAVVEGDEGAHQLLVLPGVAHVEVIARRRGGEVLGVRGIDLVPADAVASIAVVEGVPRVSFEGESRVLVALAHDGAGGRLVGAGCAWSIDGVRSGRTGDVLPLLPSTRAIEVEATFAGHDARVTIAP